MNDKNTGGPAFPMAMDSSPDGPAFQNEGMTLRDYFAGQALVAIIGLESGASLNGECSDAYLYADAMLAERDKEEKGGS